MLVTATVETPIRESFRVEQVRGMFDLPAERVSRRSFTVELPDAAERWAIGAIVGPSGSGKSTVARAAFGPALYEPGGWPSEEAVIEALGEAPLREVTGLLTAVGFGSPPAWLRPYGALSNGERFRCDLARALLFAGGSAVDGPEEGGRNADRASTNGAEPPLVVFDEFTSVVDRRAAQLGALAVSRAIRAGRVRARLVAVSCHYDMLPWLAPDWTLDLALGRLARGSLPRPPLRLRVVRGRQAAWKLFARHHYLSGALSRAAECYLALWEEEPIAFCAVLGLFGRPGRKRVHRLVTLPDFQGVGIGSRLLGVVCREQQSRGFRVHLTTSHPGLIAACRRAPQWRVSGVKKVGRRGRQECHGRLFVSSARRSVVSFEWLGEPDGGGAAAARGA